MPMNKGDIETIRANGITLGLQRELIHTLPGGRLVFTTKGIEYYRFACYEFGVAAKISQIETRLDLFHLNQAIRRACIARQDQELRDQLEAGAIPVRNIALTRALLTGDLQKISRALKSTSAASAAGENVIALR
ncbi:MAG: hypothetical protein KGL90_00755 [Burkholderiales bacterium]|nr:hypothetical protein [Burkholderiales bacterium]